MRQAYLTLLPALLLVTLLSTSGRAQTTIATQSFEGAGTWNFTPTPATYNTNGDVWAITNDVININTASDGTMFWGMRDLNNSNGGGNFDHDLTFDNITVTGETAMLLSFDWNVHQLNTSSDDLRYEVIINGTGQGEVQIANGNPDLIDTGWNTENVPIPDGTTTVGLRLIANIDGGSDAAGYDNISLTADNPSVPCSITSFGPTASATCTSFNNDPAAPDGYSLGINYSGIDADATLAVSVGGSPVAFDISTGDDPTTDPNGTLVVTSAAFLEGTNYEVVLTDAGGNCNFTVSGSVAADACEAVCDLSATFPDDVTITCTDFTSIDNADAIMVEIDYSGVEPGATVTAPGLTISGDDPAVDPDGTIIITGLVEGGSYVVTINGGDCTGGDAINFPIPVPGNFCTPSAIVINEVLADPGSIPANDANNDGTTNGSSDEFIELFNTSEMAIELSDYTLSEGAGVRYMFDPGFILPGRAAFVLFGGGTPNVPCLSDVADTPFIGLNNGGDIVTLRNAAGLTVAQMSYGAEGNNDQSIALATDGDVSSGYVQHTTIPNPSGSPLTHSACLENDDPQFALPIELLNFTATTTDKTVTLAWTTTNEVANDHFVVERSANGRQWQQLGSVEAAGRTAGEYTFLDGQPRNGENIYRLRQVDLDGSFALYGPVLVTFTTEQLRAFPNPAHNALRLNQALAPTDQLEVMDNHGRRMPLPANNDGQIDVSGLRAGLYLLRLKRGDQTQVIRFVKQ